MAFKTIIYEKIDSGDAIAKITLNRPEYRNAQNRGMTKELVEAFDMAEEDDEVKVVVLAGAGPSFSGGHDMGTPEAKDERAAEVIPEGPDGGSAYQLKYDEDAYLIPTVRMQDIPKPTIAMVQGYAFMGGMMLAQAMDIIIASDDAQFCDRSCRMQCQALEYFPTVWDIGGRRTKEMLFTGDLIDAKTALAWGLVNKVVPKDKLEEETMDMARRIAKHNPFLLKLAKKMVNDQLDLMGKRVGMQNGLYLHVLCHAHWKQVGQLVPGREEGMTVKEWVEARDKKFGDKQK